MAPQNDQQPQFHHPLPVRLGSYSRRVTQVTDRVLAEHGLTEHSDDDGVAPLDVCAFQSSV